MPQPSEFLKRIIASVVVAAFVAYVFVFFYRNPERLQRLFELSATEIAILTLVSVLTFAGLGQQLVVMLQPYPSRLSWMESFQLSVANTLLNYLPIKSGILAKGLYLKSAHQLHWRDYVLALTAGQLLWVIVSAIAGCIAGLFLLFGDKNVSDISLVVVILLLACAASISGGVLVFPGVLLRVMPFRRVKSFLEPYFQGIEHWRGSARLVEKFGLVSLGLFFLFAARIWFSFHVVGQDLSLPAAVLFQACVAAGFAFSLVPGNLGLKEGVLVGLAVMLGFDVESALLAAVIDRAASLVPVLVLGPVFLHRLTNRMLRD